MLTRQRRPNGADADPAGDAAPRQLLAIAGDHAKLEGKFDIADSIVVECEIGGELKVGDELVIGRNGIVRANVETTDAVIHGQFEGNLKATGEVEITPTGRVTGNLETDSLVIHKGGFFNGEVVKITLTEEKEGQPRPVKLVDERRAVR